MPLCETLIPYRFGSHGGHKGHGERRRQIVEKPLWTLCLHAKLYPIPFWISRRSQRTRRGAEKALKKLCSKLCLSRSPHRPRRGGRQRFKNLRALCASVRNFYTSHPVFGSHGDHRGHGGGAEKALKNLCSKLCLSRSPHRPRRGGRQRFKNLRALCASVRNSYPIPFWISRRSQRTRRGAEKALKNLYSKLCLSRRSQRTRREAQTNR